jgi:hypothetical protein
MPDQSWKSSFELGSRSGNTSALPVKVVNLTETIKQLQEEVLKFKNCVYQLCKINNRTFLTLNPMDCPEPDITKEPLNLPGTLQSICKEHEVYTQTLANQLEILETYLGVNN